MRQPCCWAALLLVIALAAPGLASPPPGYIGTELYTLQAPFDSLVTVGSSFAGNPVAGGQVVGTTSEVLGYYEAAVWNLPTGAITRFELTGLTGLIDSAVTSTDGTNQAGAGYSEFGELRAVWWNGSPNAPVLLHPSQIVGLTESYAHGVGGGGQVGVGVFGLFGADGRHALTWQGTAASAVDLHPVGASGSSGVGTDGTQQVGDVYFGPLDQPEQVAQHAALWSGTADSFIDLNPNGFTNSRAIGVYGGQQVGAGDEHALVWSGSAESATDLHPTSLSGIWGSVANNTNGSVQVGNGFFEGPLTTTRAIAWFGTADSAVDLHELLPAGFTNSTAYSIDPDGTIWGIALKGSFPDTTTHAVKWTLVPEPTTLALCLAAAVGVIVRRRRLNGADVLDRRRAT